jgi:hypothetical protein
MPLLRAIALVSISPSKKSPPITTRKLPFFWVMRRGLEHAKGSSLSPESKG